jgi:WXG100 family type VII secretion target
MSSRFVVEFDLLQEVVDRMAAFESGLEQRLADVDARIARLHQSWSGAAAAEQARAHREWVSGARQMREAIATLRAIGATAHGNYSAAIVANRQMWG